VARASSIGAAPPRMSDDASPWREACQTVLSARIGDRYVFLHGFAKKAKANIAQDETKALQFAGKLFLELSPADLAKALQAGVLVEAHCVQQTH
jgi:hypothetical protein